MVHFNEQFMQKMEGEAARNVGTTATTKITPSITDSLANNILESGLPKTGCVINNRYYTRHALERMAPDTSQIRAQLEQLARDRGIPQYLEPPTVITPSPA
jgi:hypothetical protein